MNPLTDDEKKIIIEALRHQEGSSRRSFGKWLCDNTNLIGEDRWKTRVEGTAAAWKHIADLREKFGDTKPVNVKD